MTPAARKRRYRTDPEFRAAVLAANQRSRERDPNPHRARLNRLAAAIADARKSIEYHMTAAERKERRLIEMCRERDLLKECGRLYGRSGGTQ